MGNLFKGVFTAIVTPFNEAGNVDELTFRKLIDFQIDNGINGIVPCGTTGESPTLSHEEHDRVIELTVEQADKRALVIAGTGSNSTSEAVRLSHQAEKAGVDAVMLVNPYYNKPTQEGLFRHFREVANAVKVPVIIYNIKGRTGVNLETDTLIRLEEACSNILGVKEASGDIEQMKNVIARVKSDFSVLSGDDNMALELIEAGGHGVISVASNIIPDKMSQMIRTALQGNIREARELEAKLNGFFKAAFVETNPIPIKAAMAMKGMCLEKYRLPMCPLSSAEARQTVADALKDIGLL